MHKRTDLRIRRTHAQLREALIQLIEEKGFDAVTVGDIAERAMVNRATFYRHFQDKYALVSSIFREAADRLNKELGPPLQDLKAVDRLASELAASPAHAASSKLELALTAWTRFFEHFARHGRLYQTMLGKKGSSWFASQMRDYGITVLSERFQASHALLLRKGNDPEEMPEEVVMMCVANWFLGVLTWWLENDMPYTPRQMAHWSLRFVTLGYVSALDSNVSLSQT
jgi:AcrR family transcriptional regulator